MIFFSKSLGLKGRPEVDETVSVPPNTIGTRAICVKEEQMLVHK
jgi:hypothetical protein